MTYSSKTAYIADRVATPQTKESFLRPEFSEHMGDTLIRELAPLFDHYPSAKMLPSHGKMMRSWKMLDKAPTAALRLKL